MKRDLTPVFMPVVLCAILLATTASAQVPTLQRPLNGATGVPVPPTLYWNEFTGADIYQVQVSTSSGFTHTDMDVQTSDTSRVASTLDYSTLYYWRVRAGVDIGGIQWGNWSAVWSFTTEVECDPPGQPTLQVPSQGATGITVPVSFDWSDASNATSYRIQVDDAPDFASLVSNQTTTNSSVSIAGFLDGTQYWWRVRAYNECGDPGDWSPVWNFTTEDECDPPGQPSLQVPSQGATGVSVPVSFDWSDASYATSYRIQVDDAPDFASLVSNQTTTSSSVSITGFLDGTQYWWRVRAYNACDDPGSWSPVWNFTTEESCYPPGQPTLQTPSQSATGVFVPVSFNWSDVSYATSYRIQVDDASNFTSPVANQTTGGNSAQISGLSGETQYWWRVKAYSDCDSSSWSNVWDFTTTGEFSVEIPQMVVSVNQQDVEIPIRLTNGAAIRGVTVPLMISGECGATITSARLSYSDRLTGYLNEVSICNQYELQDGTCKNGYPGGFGTVKTGSECNLEMSVTAMPEGFLFSRQRAIGPDLPSGTDVTGSLVLTVCIGPTPGVLIIDTTCTDPANHLLMSSEAGGAIYPEFTFGTITVTHDCTPVPPTLLAPSTGSGDVPVPVSFNWSDAECATGYQIQVDDASSFADPVVDQMSSVSDAVVSGLSGGTQYWWRVREYDDCISGDWSTVWSFTTYGDTEFSVVIPDLVVSANQQDVEIPIRLTNGAAIRGVNVPLMISGEGGATITSARMSYSDRLTGYLNEVSICNQYELQDGTCKNGYPGGFGTVKTGSECNLEMPVTAMPEGFLFSRNKVIGPVLPSGTDVTGSLVLTVDIGPSPGVLIIDTTCTNPASHLLMISEGGAGIYPEFTFGTITVIASCCGAYTGGYTGNCNCSVDGKITLSDISKLIDRIYISKAELCCEENGNANGSTDGKLTLSDISALIDNVYISKEPTAPCP